MGEIGVGRGRGAIRLVLAAVAALSLGLVGVPPPAAAAAAGGTEWPQFRGGPARQGSFEPSAITPANVSTLGPAWRAEVGTVVSSPAVVGSTVYVGVATGLNAYPTICAPYPSCAPLWTAPTGGAVGTSPAVAAGVVYVGSTDHKLYAFDAAGVQGCSGTPVICNPLWTATTGDAITSSPVVAGGRVYVGSDDDLLYAFDAAGATGCGGTPRTCAPLWTGATGGNVASTPAIAGGVVYVGSDSGSLFAFDAAGVTGCAGTPRTCAPLWTAPTGTSAEASPAVANGVVFVGDNGAGSNGKLLAYDAAGAVNCAGTPKTCSPLWTAVTGAFFASPAVTGGMVYVNAFDRKLYAFDAGGTTNCAGVPKACTPVWTAVTSQVTGAIGISSPAVANGLVFVGTGVGDHQIHAFDAAGATNCAGTPKTCTPVWTGETESSVRSSPALAGDYLYVGTDGAGLRAFGLPVSSLGAFHALGPHRIYDSREEGGALGSGESRNVTISGRSLVPATGVSAVVLNVAVTQPSTGGYLTLSPSGTARPLASSINFAPGQTIANAVVVKLGTGGAIDVYNALGGAHVVLDLEGWYGAEGAPAGARYTPLSPTRILDTRSTSAVGPGQTLSLPMNGVAGMPLGGVTAVVLNVAVTQPTAHGYLTVFPSGARPIASSINFAPGQTISNKVVVAIGETNGNIDIYNPAGATHVVVDVEGWFGLPGSAPGAPYHPVVPARILDTREGSPAAPDGTLSLLVAGRGGVPATGVTAVVVNVAVTQPTAYGYLTVYPSGETRPLASSINFAPGDTISNMVMAKVGADGRIAIYNPAGSTQVIVDVEGWFGA